METKLQEAKLADTATESVEATEKAKAQAKEVYAEAEEAVKQAEAKLSAVKTKRMLNTG